MAFDTQQIAIEAVDFDQARPFYENISDVHIGRLDELSADNLLQNFGVFEGGELIGAIALSVEYSGVEKWLIVNAYSARAGRDMTRFMEEQGIHLARGTGCAGIRLWTRRKGLQHKLEATGWETRAVMELRTDDH